MSFKALKKDAMSFMCPFTKPFWRFIDGSAKEEDK